MDISLILSLVPLTLLVIVLIYKAIAGVDESRLPADTVRSRLIADNLEPLEVNAKRLKTVVGDHWRVEFSARTDSGEVITGHAEVEDSKTTMHYPPGSMPAESDVEW